MNIVLLNNLQSENKKRKRVGRGDRSHGNKSGRGSDGQKARSGSRKVNMEGGQSPTYLRSPKRGFHSINRKTYEIVKTSQLYNLVLRSSVNKVSREDLVGFLRCKTDAKIKILFDTIIDRIIDVEADALSANASKYVRLIEDNNTHVKAVK